VPLQTFFMPKIPTATARPYSKPLTRVWCPHEIREQNFPNISLAVAVGIFGIKNVLERH